MTIKEKIADLIKRGAIQLSRKYRTLGLAPELKEGETYLELLKKSDPHYWANLERCAKEWLLRNNDAFQVKLSIEEFSEWLHQNGRKPLAKPPEGYDTWQEYWDHNDEHPKGVKRYGEEDSDGDTA